MSKVVTLPLTDFESVSGASNSIEARWSLDSPVGECVRHSFESADDDVTDSARCLPAGSNYGDGHQKAWTRRRRSCRRDIAFVRRPSGHRGDSAILNQTDHHILVADDGEYPAGFITGVKVTQPDKGTEMFVYELAVDEGHRRRGLGSALANELATLARERGCRGIWVLTNEMNSAALATYAHSGGTVESKSTMVAWTI